MTYLWLCIRLCVWTWFGVMRTECGVRDDSAEIEVKIFYSYHSFLISIKKDVGLVICKSSFYKNQNSDGKCSKWRRLKGRNHWKKYSRYIKQITLPKMLTFLLFLSSCPVHPMLCSLLLQFIKLMNMVWIIKYMTLKGIHYLTIVSSFF